MNQDGKLSAIILHPAMEQRLASSVVNPKQGGGIGIAPTKPAF